MRLHIGVPPATPDFTPEEDGWTPLKEPNPWILQLIATPIGVLTGVLIAIGWGGSSVHGSSTSGTMTPAIDIAAMIGIGFPALIATHELIHTLGYKRFGFTQSTMIVIWPSKLLFLAMTFDALHRNRMLLVFLLPFLAISILPLVVCRILGNSSGPLMLASTVNGLMAGGDIVGFFLILLQVPRNAIVRNQGWATWWKFADCS